VGIAKTSIADLVNAFNAGSSGKTGASGLFSGLSAMQNSVSSGITQQDIVNIQAYNDQIDACVGSQTAFYRTMLSSSKAAQDMVAECNGGKVALSGLTAAENTSLGATIALKVGVIALNVALTMGLALAIQAVITGLTKLVNAKKDAADAAQTAASEAKTAAETAKEEADSIDELIEKYKELKNSDTQDSSTRAEIADIQSQIVDLVGDQVENLDLVNGKLDEQIEKLNEVKQLEAEKALDFANTAYTTAKKASDTAIGDDSVGFSSGYEYSGKTSYSEKELRNALGEYYQAVSKRPIFGTYGVNLTSNEQNLEFSGIDVSTIEGKIDALEEMRNRLSTLEGYADDDLYTGLGTAIEKYQELLDEETDSAKSLIERAADVESYNNDIIVDSAETYEEYRKKLIDLISDNDYISGKLSSGDISTDQIETYVNDYMASLDTFSDYYDEWAEKYNSTTESVNDGEVPLAGISKAIADETKRVEKFSELTKNFSDETKEWFNGLSDSDQDIVYDISLEVDDSATFTLEKWKSELETVKETGKTTESSLQDFYDLMQDTDDGNFSTVIDDFTSQLDTLQSALDNYYSGNLSNSDIFDLMQNFPILTQYADDLGTGIKVAMQDIIGSTSDAGSVMEVFDEQIQAVGENSAAADALRTLRDEMLSLYSVADDGFSFKIDAEIGHMDTVYDAIEKSVSSTGLDTDTINSVKQLYQNLEGYDESTLFERTANGIHLNVTALRELESEYEKQKKSEIDSHLDDLISQYNDLTEQINDCSDAAGTADLYAQRADILEQINDTADLAAQYEGLTSAFNKWEEAQSTPDEDDMFTTLSDGLDDIKELFDSGRVGVDDFREAVQLMTDTDLSTASVEELMSVYDNGFSTMKQFFTGSQDGLLQFLNTAKTVSDELGEDWVKLDENGNWSVNLGVGGDEELANAINEMTDLQMSTEEVQILLRAMSAYGFDVNLDSAYSSFELLQSDAEEANDKLKELSKTDYTFTFDTQSIDDVNEQITKAQDILDTFKDTDGNVDVSIDGAQEAQTILGTLISNKQTLTAPEVMQIDTTALSDVDTDISNAISLMQEFTKYSNDLEIETSLGIDTSDTQEKLQNVASKLDEVPDEVKTKLELDDEDFQTALTNLSNTEVDVSTGVTLNSEDIESVQSAINGIKTKDIELLTNSSEVTEALDGIDEYTIDDKTFNVSIDNNPMMELYSINSYVIKDKTYKVTAETSSSGTSDAQGSAYAKGVAYNSGDWGIKNSGTALGGELGQELVVRDGKYFTIGDNGAEFFNYKKGDIIFNAAQTKELFENGRVTSYGGRGKSFAKGTAFSNAQGTMYNKGDVVTVGKVSSSNDNSSSSKSNSKTALEKFQEWFSKLFDWIEIKLERQADKIEKYTTKADNAQNNGNYKSAAKNYRKAINATTTQVSYEQKAASKYNTQANSVLKKAVSMGVVSQKQANSIAKKVKSGSMNISEYSDKIQEVIKDYQEWYEKSKSAKDAITELHQSIREYIQDLKDVRDAQRDAKLESIDTYSSIGTSGVTQTSAAKNSQLNYTNSQLKSQNGAYDTEVKNVSSDTTSVGKTGTKAINKALKTSDAKKKKVYKKALNNAKKAIESKQKVSSADLKTIKKYSISVYEKIYAYNIALDNLETAKLEQATNYAATSSEIYQNIAETYSNMDEETNDNISLLSQKANNATTASAKNSYLSQQAAQYDTILSNDDAEINRYSAEVSSNKSTILKKNAGTSKYKKLDSATQAAVKKKIEAARKAAKSGVAISASVISALAKYYSKGYVTKAFYQACVDYNNAIESKAQAEAQKEIDEQTAIAEKAAIGTQMVSNVEQEYTNKLNENSSKTAQITTAQSLKTTRGLSLTASDYKNLINQSKTDQSLYSQAASAISQQIQANLAAGYWTTDSQEYKDAIQTMNDYSNKAEECRVEQEEWNNAIAQIPYTNLEKVLDLLDSIKDNYKSLLSISSAKGLTETESQYLTEIANLNAEIARYQELRAQAWSDYRTALNSADSVYGGKTADEWLEIYYDYDTSINNLTADIVELNNSIADLPYQSVEKILSLLESAQSYDKSSIDYKSALGLDLSVSDYEKQMENNSKQIEQYQKERTQAYADYLKALSNSEGVYGGKTANEWLTEYNQFGTSINNLLVENEELKDSLRDDVYWRTFEKAHAAAQRFQDVLSGLSELIDDDMYFDDDNNLTEYGVAQVANLVSEYENARKEVQNYQADIENLNKLYADGFYTEDEYTEKLNELQVSLLDSASSMKKFSDSIVDMYKDMAQSELDSLMDLIDARNDALSAKKSYYEYDKTIKDRTKDIQTLEAEIAALEGVETAEAKAKRATYEAQLSDAKDELEDTINEHIFDLSQDALDELKNTLQDAFDDKWDNINSNLTELANLMSTANQLTSSSAGTIVSTMNKLLDYYGIDPVASGIQAAYASGTRNVPKKLNALTNEKGNEIIVTKDGMITPLEQGDGVIPSYLTDRLYDLALKGVPTPNITMPDISFPDIEIPATEVSQHFDSLINIEGSADAATVEDLKALSKDILEKSYNYTSEKIYKGYLKSGGKRYV
jgi:hypothetical protein